jgi:cardiolipin synthase
MSYWLFHIFAYLAWAILLFLVFLVLFEPGLRYAIKPRAVATDSEEFLQLLGALCDAQIHGRTRVEVLKNGETFYPAELSAIASARETINLEAYIFQKGNVAQQFVDALAERARAGVRVKVVVDAIGSLFTPDRFFQPIRDAGGRVEWYQPLRWYTFKRWNNRTHRKLMVIDGRIAFCGGADIGDDWLHGSCGQPRWRDTVFRFEGDLVTGLQSTFAENWLESSGEILANEDYFPRTRENDVPPGDATAGLVVNSTPSAARGTRAHILYQTLIAYAQKTIHITTPYFLPDRSSLGEIVKAARDRGVKVIVLTPGKHSDHLFTRSSSRRRYGDLIKAGVEVYEYRPAMIHAKTMVVDGLWSIVGSTNFDNRSFGLNDEVNVALRNSGLAENLEADCRADLEQSRRISYERWEARPIREKILEWVFRMFDRQF